MSLVQHLPPVHGVDRQPSDATSIGSSRSSKTIRRELNYAPVTAARRENRRLDNIPAYNVSVAKRAAQVCITVLACWFASGIVYGFAAIKPIFVAEGVYRDFCTDEELRQDVLVCQKQNIRLNLMFILSSITTNVSALPVGALLDQYGPRFCGIVGSLCLATGSILMSCAFSFPKFDGHLTGSIFLSLGGTFIFVPSFQIANAFPRHSGLIVAIITGSFDASAAVFLFYRLAYDATNHAFKPNIFFLYYLFVPLLITLFQITILPRKSYYGAPELEQKMVEAQDAVRDAHECNEEETDDNSELRQTRHEHLGHRLSHVRRLNELVGSEHERQRRAEREERRRTKSAVWGVLHGQPAGKQIRSPWFILIAILTALQMLRMNYFIATIRSQYRYMLDSETKAAEINHFFDSALPVGGAVCTPFIGLCLDNLSVPAILCLILWLATIVGALNALHYVQAGYATVCLFVILRPFYYSAMSDYAAKVFGFATFGRVYGTIIGIAGVANIAQYGLDALTSGPFHGNPTPVNIALVLAGFVVGLIVVVFVRQKMKALKPVSLREHEVDEHQRLTAEEDEDDYSPYISSVE